MMIIRTIGLILLASTLFNPIYNFAQANSSANSSNLKNTLSSQAVKQWQRLLHLDPSGKPTVNENLFYLSRKHIKNKPQIKSHEIISFNALEEYQTNLKAMQSPSVSVKNAQTHAEKHAQCRFPARFIFIKKHNPKVKFPNIKCPDFEKWQANNVADSVSLIFASSYLGNPASMYGHILIKLNQNNGTSYLLDQSVNYGARTPDNENMLAYIVKGIFGGYNGYFSQAEFYNNNRLYGEVELRDLAEYELKLTSFQKEVILAHLYEMQSVSLPYYFFKENCGLQVGDIISAGTGDKYYQEKPWVLPFEVIDKLDQKGLIKNEINIPSRQTRFFNQYQQLNEAQRNLFLKLVNLPQIKQLTTNKQASRKIRKSTKNILNSLPDNPSRIKVGRTALDYFHLEYINTKNKTIYDAKRYPVLGYLAALKTQPEDIPQNKPIELASPLKATKPSKISLGFERDVQNSNRGLINFRAANNDSLNINIGRPKFSYLKMLDFTVGIKDSQNIEIRELIAVEIRSIQAKQTSGLEFDEDMTWQFKVAYEKDDYSSGSFVSGGKGLSSKLGEDMVISILLNGRIKTGGEGLSVSPETRLIYNNNKLAFETSIKRSFNKNNHFIRTEGNIDMVYNFSKTLDVRMRINKQKSIKSILSVGLYF